MNLSDSEVEIVTSIQNLIETIIRQNETCHPIAHDSQLL